MPHISTREEAEGVARASHHYPDGDRSSATGGRTNRFGAGLSTPEYYAAANREVLVIVMIETPEAVENVRAIASVPGVDALLVGSSDLTQTMGMATPAELDAAIDKVIEGTKAEGKAIGVAGAGMSLKQRPAVPALRRPGRPANVHRRPGHDPGRRRRLSEDDAGLGRPN